MDVVLYDFNISEVLIWHVDREMDLHAFTLFGVYFSRGGASANVTVGRVPVLSLNATNIKVAYFILHFLFLTY